MLALQTLFLNVGANIVAPFDLLMWTIGLHLLTGLTRHQQKIRAKVREALDLHLVKWVAEILEWSINRDICKGNASSPTKVHLAGFTLDLWIVLKHSKL